MGEADISNNVLFHVDSGIGRAFSWTSIGLAVLTAFLQGLVTAIAAMTESSSRWTFRFRLALVEHWWWTLVSALLLASLIMNSLSFASGNGGSPITVLTLSAATFLAIVSYTLPAWQYRHYIQTRWLAWTNDSRTGIHREKAGFCKSQDVWKVLVAKNKAKLAQLPRVPSDLYGWRLFPVGGIQHDPTDILDVAHEEDLALLEPEANPSQLVGLYSSGDPDAPKVSLRWGRQQGFRRRVSRAVSSMPLGLLRSFPVTSDGYDGKGLTTAMGILGRIKGLHPDKLVFNMDKSISTWMETHSTWNPRPAKVLRSFYQKTLDVQYSTISPAFVFAATELALLLQDIPYWAINKWLMADLEHQSLTANQFLANEVLSRVAAEERSAALEAHYHSSLVSMIVSLNSMDMRMKSKSESSNLVGRPDLICLGLLLKARQYPEPSWWKFEAVRDKRQHEIDHLSRESDWKLPMAQLLGLEKWPIGFENPDSVWDSLIPPDSKLRSHCDEPFTPQHSARNTANDTPSTGSTISPSRADNDIHFINPLHQSAVASTIIPSRADNQIHFINPFHQSAVASTIIPSRADNQIHFINPFHQLAVASTSKHIHNGIYLSERPSPETLLKHRSNTSHTTPLHVVPSLQSSLLPSGPNLKLNSSQPSIIPAHRDNVPCSHAIANSLDGSLGQIQKIMQTALAMEMEMEMNCVSTAGLGGDGATGIGTDSHGNATT